MPGRSNEKLASVASNVAIEAVTSAYMPSIKNWYEGRYVPEDNTRSLVFMMGHFERHWTARVARAVAEFHREEWKWALPFYLAVIALVVNALIRLP